MNGIHCSLFSPPGRSAERKRGDEGAFAAYAPGAWRTPASDPSGHHLPAGEKKERASCR